MGYEVVVEASTGGILFPAMGGLRQLGLDTTAAAGSGVVVSAVAEWHSSR